MQIRDKFSLTFKNDFLEKSVNGVNQLTHFLGLNSRIWRFLCANTTWESLNADKKI